MCRIGHVPWVHGAAPVEEVLEAVQLSEAERSVSGIAHCKEVWPVWEAAGNQYLDRCYLPSPDRSIQHAVIKRAAMLDCVEETVEVPCTARLCCKQAAVIPTTALTPKGWEQ
jgi:hypothetical protein